MEEPIVLASSKRVRIVLARAQKRADRSQLPNRYMNSFEDKLFALLKRGDDALLNGRGGWQDPVQDAAEVEALCAYRALKHWGTGHGLVLVGKSELRLDAA